MLELLNTNISAGLERLGVILSAPAMPLLCESQQREHSARVEKRQFSGGGAGIVKNFR